MKKDFYEYFVATQQQYNEMLKILEKVNKELEEGNCTQEQRDNFETYFNNIKANYERLAYVKHLLNLPPKFIQRFKNKQSLKELEKRKKELEDNKADKDSVLAENKENLEKMAKQLEEVQNG